MSDDRMLLIAGLPGAGKSSVARRVAEAFPSSVHLEVDKLRAMAVSGHIATDEASGWSDALARQLALESEAACTLARFYRAQAIKVVRDDVAMPPVFSTC